MILQGDFLYHLVQVTMEFATPGDPRGIAETTKNAARKGSP